MKLALFVLLVLSIIDDMLWFSYEYVEKYLLPFIPSLTPEEWQTTKVIAIVSYYVIGDKNSHDRIKGTVTDKEIRKVRENQGIPLKAVSSIDGKILYAHLFYPDTKVTVSDGSEELELCVHGKSLIPLIGTRLNQWSIKEELFSIKTSDSDKIFIKYSPIGKYAWPLSYEAIDCYIVLIAFVGETAIFEDIYHSLLIPLLVIFAVKFLIFTGLMHCQKVQIILTDDKIEILDSQGVENSIEVSDVAKVEKGIFRVKVTGKSGWVTYLPRGCYLLPELITELTGLKERSQ